MSRETFIPKAFNAEHQRIIEHAVDLLEDMREQGYAVTLRSLYYQFIAEERWFPNTLQSYKRFGGIISDGRLAGEIPWDLIEDRARVAERISFWSDPTHIMDSVVTAYKEDLWIGQERRVHVRIEKDALIGVIDPICKRWRLPYIACRGNTSQSEAYEAGKELAREIDEGLWPLVLYLGDHDPSGIDMTRDNIDRLSLFARADIEVRRIALNRDQVDRWRLPGNPCKLTDSRSGLMSDGSIRPGSYIDLHGRESWELDAIKPRDLEQIISDAVSGVIDHDKWAEREAQEEHNHGILKAIHGRWDEVEDLFGGDGE